MMTSDTPLEYICMNRSVRLNVSFKLHGVTYVGGIPCVDHRIVGGLDLLDGVLLLNDSVVASNRSQRIPDKKFSCHWTTNTSTNS